MSNGLKNIQSHARAYVRRERLGSGQLDATFLEDSVLDYVTPIDGLDVPDQSYSSVGISGSSTGPHSTSAAAGAL
jgi:hypothetical protein